MISIEDPVVQKEVEAQLIEDLKRFGISNQGLQIDWSDSVPEGGGTEYKGVYVESGSDVVVKKSDEVIGYGWTEHIVDSSGKLFSFWTVFDKAGGEPRVSVADYEDSFGIPKHIWDILTEKDKNHLADTHQGWSQDGKLRPYRKAIVTPKIERYSKDLLNSLEQGIPKVEGFDSSLYEIEAKKMLALANEFLSGKLMNPNISTETWDLRAQVEKLSPSLAHADAHRLQQTMDYLSNLEGEVRHAAIAISNEASLKYE